MKQERPWFLERGLCLMLLVAVATAFLRLWIFSYDLRSAMPWYYELLLWGNNNALYPKAPMTPPMTLSLASVEYLGGPVSGIVYSLMSRTALGVGISSMLTLSILFNALYIAGALALYRYARLRGLESRTAMLVGLAYVLCYQTFTRLSFDIVDTPASVFLILAAYAEAKDRPALFVFSLVVGTSCNPTTGLDAAIYAWLAIRQRGRDDPRPPLVTRSFAIFLSLWAMAKIPLGFALAHLPSAFSPVAVEGARIMSEASLAHATREQLLVGLTRNFSGLVLLALSFGGFCVYPSKWLLIAVPDFAYYMFGRLGNTTSTDHGPIYVTVGLMSVAMVDALSSANATRRFRLLGLRLLLCVSVVWAANLFLPLGKTTPFMLPTQSQRKAVPALFAAVAQVPREVRCETHSSFGYLLEDRCRVVLFSQRYPCPPPGLGPRYDRTSGSLPLADVYLIDIGRIAGQESSEGFPGVDDLDGGCIVVTSLMHDIAARKCRTTFEAGELRVVDCRGFHGSSLRDERLLSRLGDVARTCRVANTDYW